MSDSVIEHVLGRLQDIGTPKIASDRYAAPPVAQ